jgi:hypothetical protein
MRPGWRGLDPVAHERAAGLTPGDPVQWTLAKPRASLADPWRPAGTPALGETWYGPMTMIPFFALTDEYGWQIADAARFAAQHGRKFSPLGSIPSSRAEPRRMRRLPAWCK